MIFLFLYHVHYKTRFVINCLVVLQYLLIFLFTKNEFLKKLKKWLCQTPNMTTIRIDSTKPSIENVINEQLHQVIIIIDTKSS